MGDDFGKELRRELRVFFPLGFFQQLPKYLHQSHLGWRVGANLGVDQHRLIKDYAIALLFGLQVSVRRHIHMG